MYHEWLSRAGHPQTNVLVLVGASGACKAPTPFGASRPGSASTPGRGSRHRALCSLGPACSLEEGFGSGGQVPLSCLYDRALYLQVPVSRVQGANSCTSDRVGLL